MSDSSRPCSSVVPSVHRAIGAMSPFAGTGWPTTVTWATAAPCPSTVSTASVWRAVTTIGWNAPVKRSTSDLERRGKGVAYDRMLRDRRDDVNVSTVMHEVAHQLSFNGGLLNRHGDAPAWLVEGLAVYCEATSSGSWQGIGEPNPPRAAAALRGRRPGLRTLVEGDDWLRKPEAVEDVRAMRRRIIESVPPKERDRELKRGPGGLRDIEFAVQLLQLVHGRGDEALRSGSTLDALRALAARGYVGRGDGEALASAYRFLRVVEHRLQLQRLRRTHTVPDDTTPEGAVALRWLARGVGFRSNPQRRAVEAFKGEWANHAL